MKCSEMVDDILETINRWWLYDKDYEDHNYITKFEDFDVTFIENIKNNYLSKGKQLTENQKKAVENVYNYIVIEGNSIDFDIDEYIDNPFNVDIDKFRGVL